MAIRGTLGASLIDHLSGLTVASAGRALSSGYDVADLGPLDVVRAAVSGPAFASPARPGYLEDIVVTAANGYHLLHFVTPAFDARLVFYVWLDRVLGNLAITQRFLHTIGGELVAA
jgi:hypothetical protein